MVRDSAKIFRVPRYGQKLKSNAKIAALWSVTPVKPPGHQRDRVLNCHGSLIKSYLLSLETEVIGTSSQASRPFVSTRFFRTLRCCQRVHLMIILSCIPW